MDYTKKDIALFLKKYEDTVPAWAIKLNKVIITSSINQSNCINEQHRKDGIRLSAINILYNIAKNGGISTQKELTANMSISKQALTLAVNSLESHGYVTKHDNSSDRRFRYIHLTKAGFDFLCNSEVQRTDFLNALANVITKEEALQTIAILERVNAFYKDYLDQI